MRQGLILSGTLSIWGIEQSFIVNKSRSTLGSDRKSTLTKSSNGAVQAAADDRQIAAEQVLDVARRVWGRLERENQ